MRKTFFKISSIPLFFSIICFGAHNEAKAIEQPKEIRIYINLDKAAKSLGITSPQISGKASLSFLQKGVKPVFINESESKKNDHLRIDVSAREKLVWITVSYIKVFKFKFRGSYSYESGVVWSADKPGVTYNNSRAYLEFIRILIDSFFSEHYYSLRS